MRFTIRKCGSLMAADWHKPQRLALVCEGGGQRGIFTAGVLDTFLKHDFFPFGTLIGVSAGAQNLSSYACGMQGFARHIIVHYTTQRAFFNPMRFARGGHLIDLDWLFDTSAREYPLDAMRGQRRLIGRELYLCATRSDSLTPDYLAFRPASWSDTVKASSAIPLLYRGGVNINGVNYWDGGVADPLPVAAAHAFGADCIVVIRTQPFSLTPGKSCKLPKRLLGSLGGVAQCYHQGYQRAHQFIECPPLGVKVIELAPAQALKSQLLGSRGEALRQDYHLGQHCAQRFFANHVWPSPSPSAA